jgi:hypothetical protein
MTPNAGQTETIPTRNTLMSGQKSDASAIIFVNGCGVAIAYFMLALSI